MPKTSEMRNSKFLKKEDVGFGVLLTITSCVQENVAQEDNPPELKWTLTFAETSKPLVLNATNIQLCEKMFGSDDTDHWVGKQLVAYTDPNVPYGGKLIGGIRVRAPKQRGIVAPATPPIVAARPLVPLPGPTDLDDDIPF